MKEQKMDLDPDFVKKLQVGLNAKTEELFQLILDPDTNFLKILSREFSI